MKINEIINESIKTGPLTGRGFQSGDKVITPDGRNAIVTSNSAGSVMIRIDGSADNVYIGNWQLTLQPEYEAELIRKSEEEKQNRASSNTNSGGSSRDFSDPNNLFARSGKPHVDFQVRGTGKHWGNR